MGKRKLKNKSYYEAKIKKLEKRMERALSETDSREPSPQPSPSLPSSSGGSPAAPTPTVLEDLTNTDEDHIPLEYLEALGEEGTEKEDIGEPISNELALRWSHIMKHGLLKEEKQGLINKYQTPSNLKSVAPKLNPEIKLIMSDISLQRDNRICHRQNLTGKLLACLGKALTKVLKGNINSKQLIAEMNDGAKLAAEIFQQDSASRRFFAINMANKTIKDALKLSKSTDYLFGDDCGEKIKSTQALQKTADIIKNDKTTTQKRPKPPKKNLNWKGPPQHQQHKVRGGHIQPQSSYKTVHNREVRRPMKRAKPRR